VAVMCSARRPFVRGGVRSHGKRNYAEVRGRCTGRRDGRLRGARSRPTFLHWEKKGSPAS
jgi:hypothetical protein